MHSKLVRWPVREDIVNHEVYEETRSSWYNDRFYERVRRLVSGIDAAAYIYSVGIPVKPLQLETR